MKKLKSIPEYREELITSNADILAMADKIMEDAEREIKLHIINNYLTTISVVIADTTPAYVITFCRDKIQKQVGQKVSLKSNLKQRILVIGA